jgi:hypothetical protein
LFFTFPTNNFCHKFVERIYVSTLTFLANQTLVDVCFSGPLFILTDFLVPG